MNARQHTLLARALIDACGGVDACCKPVTRVERSQLYAYRDFNSGVFMPADIIDRLESICGNPVYSQFLFEPHQGTTGDICAVTAGCEAGEAGTDLQRLIRTALQDDDLNEAEAREIEAAIQLLENKAKQARAAIEARRPS